MGSSVSGGERMTPSKRIKYAKVLRALLDKDPDLSIEKLVRRSGAPYDMTNLIKRRWKEERDRAGWFT